MKLSHIEAVILAGGPSPYGGSDPSLLENAGRRLVDRVADALGECFERVRVVVRRGAKAPLDLPVIEDRYEVRAPLVGIHAALLACEASAIFVAPGTVQALDPRLVLALASAMPAQGGPEIVAPEGPLGPEPRVALYRPTVLPRIERQLRRNQLGLQRLLEHSDTRVVPEALLREVDPALGSLAFQR